jgi:hypothetical protein
VHLGTSAPHFTHSQTVDILSLLVETHGNRRGTSTHVVLRSFGIHTAHVAYVEVSEQAPEDVLGVINYFTSNARGYAFVEQGITGCPIFIYWG